MLSRPEWRTLPALNKRSLSAENAEGLMDEAFMMGDVCAASAETGELNGEMKRTKYQFYLLICVQKNKILLPDADNMLH